MFLVLNSLDFIRGTVIPLMFAFELPAIHHQELSLKSIPWRIFRSASHLSASDRVSLLYLQNLAKFSTVYFCIFRAPMPPKQR
jgi:hypothetical protein